MVQQRVERPDWASTLFKVPFASSVFGFPVRTAKNLVLSQIQNIRGGALIIEDVDGTKIVLGGTQPIPIELHFHVPQAWLRILLGNDIGFAEALMLGEISCSDLTAFFRMLLSASSGTESRTSILADMVGYATGSLRALVNTSEQALTNAANHYSLSNDMFAAFLDPTMTYSAPIWLATSHPDAASDTLESAQRRKLQYTISAARIRPSDHVLEIGTGWGSFAIEAVQQTGCQVTTITASEEQAKHARQRIAVTGLDDRIKVIVCDYRRLVLPEGKRFDKIVSIEMIEHVGREFLSAYFACMDKYLKLAGGIGVFQCITIPESRYAGYCKRQDFIHRYIFPGGHLPTVSGLVAAIDAGSRGKLIVEDMQSVSGHYVRALRH